MRVVVDNDFSGDPDGLVPLAHHVLSPLLAASVVSGDSSIPIWQVPRDAYRQTLASFAELLVRMAGQGRWAPGCPQPWTLSVTTAGAHGADRGGERPTPSATARSCG